MKSIQLAIVVVVLVLFGFVFWSQTVQAPAESLQSNLATESTNPAVEEIELSPREQLLAERRVLAESVINLATEPTQEMIDAVRNPSIELLDAIVEQFVLGNLVGIDVEEEFAIVDDWIEAPLWAYLESQDVFALAGINKNPLPEPTDYRLTTGVGIEKQPSSFFRFELSAHRESPVSIYAVDPTGAFSGILELHEEFKLPYSEIKNVGPSSFINQGIEVDLNAAPEFTLMMRGTDFGIFPIDYTYYSEGKTTVRQLYILTTPNMLASATVVTTDTKIDMYQWRFDYDGDGTVDFLFSNNGVTADEARDIIEFVIDNVELDLTEEEFEMMKSNKEEFIEVLSMPGEVR